MGFEIVQMNLEKELRKENKKTEKGKGGASRPRPHFWPAAEAGPARPRSPPSPHPHPRQRRDAVARRQNSVAPWRACDGLDALWSATRCARPRPPSPPLLDALLLSHSPSLSFSRAAAAAPPLAFAADARSFSPRQHRPPPSHPQPPATPPRPSAPCARAQSRSVSPVCPVELTGASQSSGNLSACAVLALLTGITCILECVSSASALRILPRH